MQTPFLLTHMAEAEDSDSYFKNTSLLLRLSFWTEILLEVHSFELDFKSRSSNEWKISLGIFNEKWVILLVSKLLSMPPLISIIRVIDDVIFTKNLLCIHWLLGFSHYNQNTRCWRVQTRNIAWPLSPKMPPDPLCVLLKIEAIPCLSILHCNIDYTSITFLAE